MNELQKSILELPLVKRIQELEHYIDKNEKLNKYIEELKQIQKKLVNAKEFQQKNQIEVYQKEYDSIYEKIVDFPFVEEYLELLNEANDLLIDLTALIEKKINEKLKD